MARKDNGPEDEGKAPRCESCGTELVKRDFMTPKEDMMSTDWRCPECDTFDFYLDIGETVLKLSPMDDDRHPTETTYYIEDKMAADLYDLVKGPATLNFWRSDETIDRLIRVPSHAVRWLNELERINERARKGMATEEELEARKTKESQLAHFWEHEAAKYEIDYKVETGGA